MPSLLNAACIGLRHGHARGLIGTFKQLEGVRVVAYCEDTDTAALERLQASEPTVRCYTSVDDLLAREAFDLACVTLPASETPAACIRLAQAGKHFLMEKQFARTVADLRPVVEAVREHRVKVLANYPWRTHPVLKAVKGMLDDGTFGRPLALHAQLVTTQVRPGLRDPQFLAYRDDTEGGGILHMEGGHWLEAFRFLMGCEVTAVTALCRPVVGNMAGENMEDVSVVGLEFANGAVGALHMGYLEAIQGASETGVELWGLEGSAQWKRMGAPTLCVRSTRWTDQPERVLTFDLPQREGVYGGRQWLFDIVQEFVHAIREDRQPAVTAEDALRVLQVIEAAYESSRLGRRVEIPYERAGNPC